MRLILIALSATFLSGSVRADLLGVTWLGKTVRIDTSTGVATFVGRTDHTGLNSLARDPSGRFVTANEAGAENPHLHYVDPLFGKASVFHFSFLNSIRAMAFSPTGELYAIHSASPAQYDLYLLDLTVGLGDTSIRQFVGTTTLEPIQGMAFAADGTLYGWAVVEGLVVIDPATAATTDVNAVWDGTSAIQCLAFAPDGTLYAAGDRLFVVDRTTGTFTPVGTATLESVRGIEFFEPLATYPYCAAKRNSQGCLPRIDSSGSATLSGPDDFQITATEILSNKTGLMIWGANHARTPFQGGFVCLRSPILRTPAQSSGGNPPPVDCSGTYSFPVSHSLMNAHGLMVGSTANAQYYYRDPAHVDGTGVGLSDALHFTIAP